MEPLDVIEDKLREAERQLDMVIHKRRTPPLLLVVDRLEIAELAVKIDHLSKLKRRAERIEKVKSVAVGVMVAGLFALTVWGIVLAIVLELDNPS